MKPRSEDTLSYSSATVDSIAVFFFFTIDIKKIEKQEKKGEKFTACSRNNIHSIVK